MSVIFSTPPFLSRRFSQYIVTTAHTWEPGSLGFTLGFSGGGAGAHREASEDKPSLGGYSELPLWTEAPSRGAVRGGMDPHPSIIPQNQPGSQGAEEEREERGDGKGGRRGKESAGGGEGRKGRETRKSNSGHHSRFRRHAWEPRNSTQQASCKRFIGGGGDPGE